MRASDGRSHRSRAATSSTSTLRVIYSCATILRVKGYRFFFFSREGQEPPHIHVEQAERYAKFWLNPVALASSRGLRSGELSEIQRIVRQNRDLFEERWHEHLINQR
ncbi:MAG: DUF4160 domain-containing protein [Blastocatellia bacterium AA13]|nr:MAG: DUF4160 domain-containing protein [Blastocatellia bacterium AA13]